MPKITYTRIEDYLLPDLILSDPPDAEPLNHYGKMRKNYLKKNHPALYGKMLLHEELYPHCRVVQQQAQERLDMLMEHLMSNNPPQDKAIDELAWVAHMNMLKHIAEEIMKSELIYSKT